MGEFLLGGVGNIPTTFIPQPSLSFGWDRHNFRQGLSWINYKHLLYSSPFTYNAVLIVWDLIELVMQWTAWILKLHTPTECRASVHHTSVTLSLSLSVSHSVLNFGCYKSCDIRIIDDIIVSCQQGQMIQHVQSHHFFDSELINSTQLKSRSALWKLYLINS